MTNKGWPDFIVQSSDGQMLLVEHKNIRDSPTPVQSPVHKLLKEHGLEVIVAHQSSDVFKKLRLQPTLSSEDVT